MPTLGQTGIDEMERDDSDMYNYSMPHARLDRRVSVMQNLRLYSGDFTRHELRLHAGQCSVLYAIQQRCQ